MRRLFTPEHDEIAFDWTPEAFQIRLSDQCGDIFLIELDPQTVERMVRYILSSQGWYFEEEGDHEAPNAIPQVELPF